MANYRMSSAVCPCGRALGLLDGDDLAAEVHAEHAERVERYQRELEAATIQEKSPEPITQTPTGK